MLTLQVNGEPRTFATEITVAALLRELRIRAPALAVEVNRRIVPRAEHEDHRLRDGDRIEIVTFVGGG